MLRIRIQSIHPLQTRQGTGKSLPQSPVIQPSNVALKDGVDDDLLPIRTLQEGVCILIRPAETCGDGEGHEEVLEGEVWACQRLTGHLVAHGRPG